MVGARRIARSTKASILWHDVEHVVHEVPYDHVGVRPVCKRDQSKCRDPVRLQIRETRTREKRIKEASCYTRAKCLAAVCGYFVDYEWPVVWENGDAFIFHPPVSGVVDDDYVAHSTNFDYIKVDRDDGIHLLRNRWGSHMHVGDVPDEKCNHVTHDGTGVQHLPTFDVVYYHDESQNDAATVMATPAAACITQSDPIRVKSWLMDSGTPLDLVDKRSVKNHKEFITNGDPVLLDTANGEVKADRHIDLYNGRLNERIAPLVLDSTPNVLSIGRRVVQQGYDWHWKGYTLTPWMVHPTTGEHIKLRVEDFCPYLDDDGSTYPAALVNHAAAVCSVVKCVSAPAPVAGTTTADPELETPVAVPGGGVEYGGSSSSSDPAPSATPASGSPIIEPASSASKPASGESVPPPPPPVGEKSPRDLKAEATSITHLLTHTPRNPYCEACKRAKMTRKPARTIHRNPDELPTKFGELVNADYIVSQSMEAMGLTGERDALAIVDRATNYKDCYPMQSRSGSDCYGALQEFFGGYAPERIYTDNEASLIRACKDLGFNHDKSTPYRHQSNAFCERIVRKVIEGARTMLEQAGLPSCFWIFAVRHWCFMDNTEVRDGESAWNGRHLKGHFAGPRLPFGCLVDFLPRPDTVKAMPKFEPRANQGILVGYRLHNGGKWAKDFLVFPLKYFEGYDYARPRNLLELTPITTRECTLAGSKVSFPLKERYDMFKNTLPSLHDLCIIRDASHYDCDEFEEKDDTDDVEVAEGSSIAVSADDPSASADHVPAGISADVPGVAIPEPKDDEEDYYWKQDSIGRWYKHDKHGNRIFSKPLHGSLRPPSIPASEWAKLSKKSKQNIYDTWKKLEDKMDKAVTASSTSSSPDAKHSVSAAARGIRQSTNDNNNNSSGNRQHQLMKLVTFFMTMLVSNNIGMQSEEIQNQLRQFLREALSDGNFPDANYGNFPNDEKCAHDVVRSCHVACAGIQPSANDDDEHEHDYVPRMPCVPARIAGHRDKRHCDAAHRWYNACVARPVKPAEVRTNKRAQAAMQLEWDRLRAVERPDGNRGCWDEGRVMEWRDVRRNARKQGKTVNVGLVFGIVVEKNFELDAGDPRRKYKGRAVFQGSNVRDQDGNWAIFQELGSNPATMEAARCADAYGLIEGHAVEQSDAEQAYTQAWLMGTETWVRLPRDQWPQAWIDAGMQDPVCPLLLALYGHPDSGTDWERYSHAHVESVGFEPVDGWPSCFWHPDLKLFLVIYVDDFKLSGPRENLAKGWDLIKSGLKIEPPGPLGLYLGCKHEESSRVLPDTGTRVRVMEYNMEEFLKSCVERYRELTGVDYLRRATTPFLPEHSTPDFSDGYAVIEQAAWDAIEAETALKEASSHLNGYAAKILMKILYAARYARLDLLRAVCHLAQFITKWDEDCDKRLYRLVCYINSTLHVRMTGWVGDNVESISPHLFADADFAGDSKLSRSTSGTHLCLLGPNTVFPLAGQCKKQGCVSHSTPEAEVVAADHAMRTYGIPCLDVWDKLLGRRAVLEFHEDNETAIGAMRHGYSPALRHVKRTHGVCIRWLAERFREPDYNLFYERSALQAADVYTKAFTVPAEWDKAMRLINHVEPKRFWDGRKEATSAGQMGSVHKGGVEFDYWTSNPWNGRSSLNIPKPESGEAVAAPVLPNSVGVSPNNVARKPPTAPATHVSWTEPPPGIRDGARLGHSGIRDNVDVLSCTASHLRGFIHEAPDIDVDYDYASTQAPDSDEESLTEFAVEHSGEYAAGISVAGGGAHGVGEPALSQSPSHTGAPNSSVGGSRPTAPASGISTPKYTRRIVEFCCGAHSLIGQLAPANCEVIRLTIDDDLTTQAGLDKAVAAVSDSAMPTLLFGALPCTGGSPYQFLNWRLGPKTRAKIRRHRAIFRVLWRHFVIVADACRRNGGKVAFEWPRGCLYWKDRRVKAFLRRTAAQSYDFDGCMFGLRSQAHKTKDRLLRKPWRIASDCGSFQGICRRCDHDPKDHVPTQGSDTLMTEGYTPEMVNTIHRCWVNDCANAGIQQKKAGDPTVAGTRIHSRKPAITAGNHRGGEPTDMNRHSGSHTNTADAHNGNRHTHS